MNICIWVSLVSDARRPGGAGRGGGGFGAVRARAAERDWAARWGEGRGAVPPRLRSRLVEFDPKYSPRSCVVVGEPAWGEG